MELEIAQTLCEELMSQWLSKRWKFSWLKDNRKRVSMYGECNKRKRLIRLSKIYVEQAPDEAIRNTCLHEIAHALNRSKKSSHGKSWKRWCLKVGAKPIRYNEFHIIKIK